VELWHALVLGIVEGITEYLPVSSTGHLILTASLLGLDRDPETKQAIDAFNIVIQGGAILAVAGLYWVRVRSMLAGLLGRDAVGRKLFFNIVIAFLPAAIIGVIIKDYVDAWLFHPLPVLFALFLGGLLLIGLTPWQNRVFREDDEAEAARGEDGEGSAARPAEGDEGAAGQKADGAAQKPARTFTTIDQLSWKQALAIGFLQCVAMWPGTSRSMMTIVGGMVVGLRPKQAAEFSFLLGLPTLGGACVYQLFRNWRDGVDLTGTLGTGPIIVGLVTAFIAAALSVRWLVGYLARNGVAAFGWYRLALCAVMAVLAWRGIVDISP